jgi:hypothetical protein
MAQSSGTARFVLRNILVWLLMTLILIVVPDTMATWLPLGPARVVSWALACSVWVIAVEQQWQRRAGPLARFAIQFVLWVSAALVAIWISDQVH